MDKEIKKVDKAHDSIRRDILIVIVTALLACIGSIVGTNHTIKAQNNTWYAKTKYQEKKDLMQIRIDLFERTNKILYKSMIFRTYDLDRKKHLSLSKIPINTKKDIEDLQKRFDKLVESQVKLNELFSEYATVMQLSSIFFGPKTSEAVKNLTQIEKWWDADPKYIKAVLESMKSEFDYSLGINFEAQQKNEP